MGKDKEKDKKCNCGENCTCGEECNCTEECSCNDECTCGEKNDEAMQYLNLAKQIQADFENFRKRAIEDIKKAKIDGQISVIEAFLPCLDTFKEAKKTITDENILKGIEMIEEKIISTLQDIGIKKIESKGQRYDPHLHNVIAVMKDESQENDIILDEYQAGYIFNDKVIRYAKVIVNKKEDK